MTSKIVEITIGSLAILYAMISVYFRIAKPALFKKMEPMKRIYGKKLGVVIHIALYTLIPLIFGIKILQTALLGTPLF